VNALKGNIFQYNYTVNIDKSRVDTSEIIRTAIEVLVNQLKKNPEATYFRENKIEIQAIYFDKNRIQICKVVVLLKEYQP
jgi:hypothetical protein